MGEWIVAFVGRSGYLGIALLMVLENVFPPIPSELIMPLAGYHTVEGQLSFVGAVLAGCIGSLVGNSAWYLLGRHVSEERLRGWARRYGRWLTISEADLDHVRQWFARHGSWAVALARVVPGIRTLISLPAGLVRMPAATFFAYSALGTLVWTALLAWAGRILAANYGQAERVLGIVSWIVLGSMVVAYVWRVVRWKPAPA